MSLTRAQQDAVRRTGQDVCVVAGPGSGKTRVLIERFAWLVEECNTDPARILAITFTEKAATEIKQRLISRFAARPELRSAIERAWVSTIDGFCTRLLREHAVAAGIAPDFAVIEEVVANRLARESAEEALDALFQERPQDMRRLLESLDLSTADDWRQPDLARSLLEIYETMRVSDVRDLAPADAAPDVWPIARERAQQALADRRASGTHADAFRAWAEAFLNLPGEIGREHFNATEAVSKIHLNKIGKGTRALEALRELREDLAPRLQQQWMGQVNAGLLNLLRVAVARIDALYRAKKRRDAVLDFGDLEEQAIRLLESDAQVREETAGRFDEVLMDELQDTNRLQWRLVNLIRRRFFAVGDINQSIYSFRHAKPEVFEEYRGALIEAGLAVDDLRENHRSYSEILEAVSLMLDLQTGIEARPLIASRGSGTIVERLVGGGENAVETEASLVASRIRQLCDSKEYEYKHIAILMRAMSAAEPFERALDQFGIPFLVSSGRTFMEAREIRDLMSLLAALVNPLDDIATVGVLRSPLVGLGDEEIFRAGREGWREIFEARFGNLRKLAGFISPDRLLATALDESGYARGLPARAEANIEKFLGRLRREHRNQPLAEVLADLEALRATQSEAEAPPAEAGNIVRLMSIHAAKGLEFPVVFVSALHHAPDRRKPVIAFSAAAGLGAKWRNPATGKGQSDTAHARIVEELKLQEKAEENRLLYVAMTRAQDRLILSHALQKRSSGWQDLATAIPVTMAADQPVEPPEIIKTVREQNAELLADPPVLSGRHDGTVAITAVSTFHACPRKYLLNSISRGEAQGSGGVATGLEVHRILAGETGSPEAAEIAARFPLSELGRRAARATRIEREFDFLFYFEDVVLRGQIDLWFEESGELIVVDYKTDRDDSRLDVYAMQLRLYALALERYAGRMPDRAVLYYLRSDSAVEVNLDPESARSAVRAFLAGQESLDYPIRPGAQCRRCPFFENRCPARLS